MQQTSYEERGIPYAPLPIYRVAEAANVLIGIGSFLAVSVAAIVAGIAHISTVWKILVFVGIAGAIALSALALIQMTTRPRKRYLRSLVLAFAAEISNQVSMVQEAISEGFYWNPAERQLSANVWLKHPELAAEPRLS